MKRRLLVSILLMLSSIGIFALDKKPIDYVDCFIGTSNSRWMLGPSATLPFGMVQLGPDNQGDKWMGGYEYAINSVSGFSHLHAWTMGGLMMMPTTADLALSNAGPDSPYKGANAGFQSRILKETEHARPGYYTVELYDHKVKVELTATTHCGFQKYTFPKCKESRVLIKLQFPTEWDYGFKVLDAQIKQVDSSRLEGFADCRSGSWSSWNNYKLHFVIKFSRAFKQLHGIRDGEQVPDIKSIEGKGDIGAYAVFNTRANEVIMVQSALSLVDMDGARRNLETEMKPFNWDFDKCVENAATIWNNLLGKIKVEGGSEENKVKFYTNLYRSYSGKQTWSDVDGRYRDACENIQKIDSTKAMYGGDAFWNSYWNLNGLWSIITPEIIDNWVTTQLEMFQHTGWTSKGPTGLEYSDIMEGSHELALMVAAYQKGIRKDGEAIYTAAHKMVTTEGTIHPCGGGVGQHKLSYYTKYGYMPSEVGVVSKTLDYAYDDFCVGQLAETLNKKKDANYLLTRSQNYKNVFNPEYHYIVQRDSTGKWDAHFDKFSNNGFIEGNSWQYSWYVPHDTKGMIEAIGGEKIASERLEAGFEKSRDANFAAYAFDRTMGQSAEYYVNQGNEINMSASFIFNYLHKPWLCQKYSREILDIYYGSTPYHGWEGDEDEGQMGAWFAMSAIGLFEMNGGVTPNSKLEITSPLFNKITIQLNSKYYPGSTFVIEAVNNSDKNRYIQSATLNGQPLKEARIPFKTLVSGGTLVLVMGNTPNYNLWTNK
jgi:predicted alpha-1,2-mannosidase